MSDGSENEYTHGSDLERPSGSDFVKAPTAKRFQNIPTHRTVPTALNLRSTSAPIPEAGPAEVKPLSMPQLAEKAEELRIKEKEIEIMMANLNMERRRQERETAIESRRNVTLADARASNTLSSPARSVVETARAFQQAVQAAFHGWDHDDYLESGGRNYRGWVRRMRQIAEEYFLDPAFFDSGEAGSAERRLAKSIIIHSVDKSLRPDLQELNDVRSMWVTLRQKFFSISRQAQLVAWRQFINPDLSQYKTTAMLISAMRDNVTTLKQLKINLTVDDLLGLILHDKVQQHHSKHEEFGRRIDLLMQNNPDIHPTFDELVRQLDLMVPGGDFNCNISKTSDQVQVFEADLLRPDSSIPADNIPDEFDIFAADMTRRCWLCRSPDHLLTNCPRRTRNPHAHFQRNGRVTQLFDTKGCQAFYPVITITPPGFRTSSTLPPATQKTEQKADLYRPRYDEVHRDRKHVHTAVKAKEVDFDENVPLDVAGMAFGSASMDAGGRMLFDTGATNHLTGDSEGESQVSGDEWHARDD